MKLIELTAPDGERILVNPEHVVKLTSATVMHHPSAKTVVHLVAGDQAVREFMEIVEGKINAALSSEKN